MTVLAPTVERADVLATVAFLRGARDAAAWLSSHADILALLADHYIRFDVLDMIVPMLSPYRPVAVGLGIVAAYCAVVVHASFGFRRKIGTKAWRRLHSLSFVAFGAAAVHAFLAGTDASRPWAIAICAVPLLGAGVLLAGRLRTALSRRART